MSVSDEARKEQESLFISQSSHVPSPSVMQTNEDLKIIDIVLKIQIE